MKIRLVTLFFLLLFSSYNLFAQKFFAGIDFENRFDNREYDSELTADQTIFGMKIRPYAGVQWLENNTLCVGGDFTFNFGARGRANDNKQQKDSQELIFYYKYSDERFSITTGIFQRDHLRGYYPNLFFSDSVRFYDANIEGVLVQYHGKKGFFELGFDWNSMISHSEREKFMLISSGGWQNRNYLIGYSATMYHFAGTLDESGVVDNVLVYPHVGYNKKWTGGRRTKELTIRTGWIQGLQKDRRNESNFVYPGGFQLETTFSWHSLGLFNTFYAGDNLMPYYSSYGGGLYMGDPFYRTTDGVYDRVELFWEPIKGKMFKFRFSSVHHFDGKGWGWQQMATFCVNLNTSNIRR